MTDPALPLSILALAASAPIAATFSLRHRDARRWSADLTTYRLDFPRGCEPGEVKDFLRALSGLLPSRLERIVSVRGIGLEIASTAEGITHTLLVPRHQIEIVLGQLRAAMPNVAATPAPDSTPRRLTLGGEFAITNRDHQIRVDAPVAVSTSILSALQPLRDESIVVQLLLMPQGSRPAPTAGDHWIDKLLGRRPSSTPTAPSPQVVKKYSEPLFAATIRLGVASKSPARDRQLLARLTAAFHASNSSDATLRRRKTSARACMQGLVRRIPPVYGGPCVLNAAELVGLLALPPTDSSVAGLRLGGSRVLPPTIDIYSSGIILADSNFPGANRPLALSMTGAQQHLLVTGPPGTGKSSLLLSIAIQCMLAGHGVILFDPKSDTARDAIDRIPGGRQQDVIVFDPLDSRPIGLNILQSADGDPDLVAEQVFAILHALNIESWGPRLADLLRALLYTLARTRGATLVDLPVLLTDANYRTRVVGALDDPIGLGAVWAWFDSLSDGERNQAISPILNKVRPWVVRPRLRHVLGQSSPKLDFDEVLADRRILIAPLSSGELGDDAATLLGAIMLTKLFQAVMRRVRLPREERRPVVVLIDEAQILGKLPTPLADMLAMARAMGVAVVVAHQTLSQFDTGLREAVLGSARSRVTFQVGASDAARFARDLSPYLSEQDLRGLRPYEVVASLSTGERVAPPATGRTRNVPPANQDGDRVREMSRLRWGRDRDDVEAELRSRHDRPTGPGPVGRQRRKK